MNFIAIVSFVIAVIAAFFILYGFYNNNPTMWSVASLFFVVFGSAGFYFKDKSTFTDNDKKMKSY